MPKKIGAILVAHGSKRAESNEEFKQLCEKIRLDNIYEFDAICHAFLEFTHPGIEMALQKMHEENISRVFIYPYFLNSGKHVSVDLPNIIDTVKHKYPNMEIKLLTHFGASKSVVSIISTDLQAVL